MSKTYAKPLQRAMTSLPGPAAPASSVHLIMNSIPNPEFEAAIWLVDGGHGLWDALTWLDQFSSLSTRIMSVQEILTACQRNAITKSRALDFVALFGHGTAGYQSAGAGQPYDGNGDKSLVYKGIAPPGGSHLNGPAESILSGLNGVLSDSAWVLLGGCNVAQGNSGSGLLKTVSTILGGRAVCGFEDTEYFWTGVLTGTLKTAQGGNITEQGHSYMKIGRSGMSGN